MGPPSTRPGAAARRLRAAAAAGLAAVLALASGCGTPPDEVGATPVDRVLVVSLPGLDWDRVRAADMPNLDRFVDQAAVADLTTRIGRQGAGPTDAYLTMGAGTRAVAPLIDTAVAVEPDESYGGVPAAELLERRLGDVPDGIAYLGMGGAIDANETSAYGAEVGTLGDELADAGVRRAVVANADAVEGFVSEDPPPEGAYARGAATMLMGSDGILPEGAVSRALLQRRPRCALRLAARPRQGADRRRRHVGGRRTGRRAGRGVRPQPGRRLRVPCQRHAAAGPPRRGAGRRRRTARRPARTDRPRARRHRRAVAGVAVGVAHARHGGRAGPRGGRRACSSRRRPAAAGTCSSPTWRRRCCASSARIRPARWRAGRSRSPSRRETARGPSPTRPTPRSSATPPWSWP